MKERHKIAPVVLCTIGYHDPHQLERVEIWYFYSNIKSTAIFSACNMLLYITYFTDMFLVGMETSVKKQPCRKI
jgi:hypothetical protein